MSDIIVDQIRQVREELITRYGGIEGYFKHCQSQDQARARRRKVQSRKRLAAARRKAATTP